MSRSGARSWRTSRPCSGANSSAWRQVRRAPGARRLRGAATAHRRRLHRHRCHARPRDARRRAAKSAAPAVVKRTRVVIAGGGVAGLAAARALRLSGIDDFALLELEDTAGGNARGGIVNGIACPLGAHYLPVPGDDAREVQDLLEELGLRRRVAGRWNTTSVTLCHSPQERLFIHGEWQDGLLPMHGVGEGTLAQYRRFAQRIDALRHAAHFAIPTLKVAVTPELLALDAITFATWLDARRLQRRATALVPRLLLPRRLRRRHRARCRPGPASTTSRAGTAFMRPAIRPAASTTRAPSATASSPGPKATAWLTKQLAQAARRAPAHWPGRHAHRRSARWRRGRCGGCRHQVARALAGRALHRRAARVHRRARGGEPARGAEDRPPRTVRYAPWLVANVHLRGRAGRQARRRAERGTT